MVTHRLLFVCLGNICRSPMAEGAFRHVAAEQGVLDRFEIDSAGLGSWHVGQAPDHRAQKAADQRGIDISGQSARQIRSSDFTSFDLLLAMDGSNYGELAQLAPKSERHKIRRFLDFAPHAGTKDVPDPFFGEAEGFDRALDLIDEAARGLLAELLRDKTAPTKKSD
jgi:low molecular weight protein-tyrosine phosphatase